MGMFFAPVANVVLGSVRPEEEGQASGANNAIRELGGVLGVSVLATIFAQYGSYQSPQSFVDGLTPAVYAGAAIAAVGAVAALFIARDAPPGGARLGGGRAARRAVVRVRLTRTPVPRHTPRHRCARGRPSWGTRHGTDAPAGGARPTIARAARS